MMLDILLNPVTPVLIVASGAAIGLIIGVTVRNHEKLPVGIKTFLYRNHIIYPGRKWVINALVLLYLMAAFSGFRHGPSIDADLGNSSISFLGTTGWSTWKVLIDALLGGALITVMMAAVHKIPASPQARVLRWVAYLLTWVFLVWQAVRVFLLA